MVISLLSLLLACSADPAEPPAVQPVDVPTPDAPAADAPAADVPEAAAPPKGVVGGAPILDRPVVLGGIDNAAVEAALDKEGLKSCNTAGRPGKVLLKFRIDKGGKVVHMEQKSSTLRHEATEACLQAAVKVTTFPELERGDSALVTWPFLL